MEKYELTPEQEAQGFRLEKSKYNESEAEEMITWLIYRELAKGAAKA